MSQFILISTAAILITLILGLAIGAVNVPFNELISVLLGKSDSTLYNTIIIYVRLPRVVVAFLVGMNLAAAGLAVQSVFRNPMASPGIIGISSGASLGALICIVFGFSAINLYFIPFFASGFALATSFIVYIIAGRSKGQIIRLILVGVAISRLIGAAVDLILSAANENQIAEYVFWRMGSLADRRWEHVMLIAVPSIFIFIFFIMKTKDLNMLLIGDDEAKTIGFDVEKGKRMFLIASSVATAISVSVSGMITFVGLIIPHIMRLIVGTDNQRLLPYSLVAGGVFLVLCDLFARTIISPAEMSVGIITSLIGAPILLYLVEARLKDRIRL